MSNSITPTTSAAQPEPSQFKSQVSPDALQELFRRDPEHLSDQDIETIVAELRTQRGRFAIEEAAKANKEKKPKGAKTQQLSLSLEDIGL